MGTLSSLGAVFGVPRAVAQGGLWQMGGCDKGLPRCPLTRSPRLACRSVEHDFRQQEGRFQRVLSHIEGDTGPSSPSTAPGAAGVAVGAAGTTSPPRQEPSPVSRLPAKLDVKKSRRKCFWFL